MRISHRARALTFVTNDWSTASSPVVNRAARAGGMGPDAASRRRRSIATLRLAGAEACGGALRPGLERPPVAV